MKLVLRISVHMAGEMVQQVKVLAAKPDDQSSNPGIRTVEEENWLL